MYGTGLLKGLGVTFKHWFQREITEQYPEQRPDLPPASQGFFHYEVDKCISCGLCVRACPNQVIKLTSEKDENNKKVVKEYVIDVQYCLYCGLCIEACPTAALVNSNNFEIACYNRVNSTFDFLEAEVHDLNKTFADTQAAYWSQKRSGENPIGMPTPYKAPRPAKPPAKKVANADQEKSAETLTPTLSSNKESAENAGQKAMASDCQAASKTTAENPIVAPNGNRESGMETERKEEV